MVVLPSFVGKEFKEASAQVPADMLENAHFFATSDELAAYLTENPLSGSVVLIKGSRGTRMENVIPSL